MVDVATPSSNQEPKMVPERDLIAAKEGLSRQLSEVKVELENTKKLADDRYQDSLTERASKEAAQRDLQTMQEKMTKLQDLETKLNSEIETRKKLESQLLDTRRSKLLAEYNIPKEVVEGKGVAELELLEQSLRLIGDRKRSGIDTSGGTTGTTQRTAREKILAGLEKTYTGR